MQPVRIGVIGCGVIGPYHMEAAHASPLTELVAVADLVEEWARAAAERFGVPRVYRDGAELLEDPEVEAVVLAFPARGRAELAIKAFERGKHVLTEKPVARNAGEVREMIAAQGDLVGACCSSRYRFLKGAQVATEFIASGALGPLRLLRCLAFNGAGPAPEKMPPEWRLKRSLNGGGILMNWGCYDLDYLLGITGWSLRPEVVFAQTWNVPPQFEPHIAPGSDAETHGVALIRCAGGAVIAFERGEYMPAATQAAWQIIGTRGALSLQMTTAEPKVIVHDDTSTEEGVTSRTLWEGSEDAGQLHSGPVTDFAAAIRHRRPPATTLRQALIIQQITDAIYESAESGEAVRVG